MPSPGRFARLLRGRVRTWLTGASVGALVLLGSLFPPGAHDIVGRLAPGPDLPVALVRVTTTPERAVRAARDAGATEVWAALPSGDPRLGGARPDPEALHAGLDGRIRYSGSTRLPLPEALGRLLVIDDVQLGPGLRLDGREAVLIWADPATGVREAVGGLTAPVDRGALVAVARGSQLAGRTLWTLPLPAAMALCAGLAIAVGHLARRTMPGRGLAWAGIGSLVLAALSLLARALGVDLPVSGLLAAILLPVLVRLSATVEQSLGLLDRLAAWMGPPTRPVTLDSDLAARAQLLAAWLPGTPVEALPRPRPAQPGEHIETVYDRGEAIGALRIVLGEQVPPDAEALARMIARGLPRGTPTLDHDPEDPYDVRIALARATVRDALSRAHQWDAIFGAAGSVMGLFDANGALVSGTPGLQARLGAAEGPPLLSALSTLTPRGGIDAARQVLVTGRPLRVPAFGGELVILPVGSAGERTGLLLHLLEHGGNALPLLLESKHQAWIPASNE